MREVAKTSGGWAFPAERKRSLSLGRWGWAWGVFAAGRRVPRVAGAQTVRLGPVDLALASSVDVAYDSNVDDYYPDEEVPGKQKGDFYWVPGFSVQSEPARMRPSTTFGLAATIAYEDYFARNDLDTEVYNVVLNFQTAHPRLTLGGMGSIDYSVEGIEDQYVPGNASRDPVLTREGNLFANWNYRKFRIELSQEYSEELHEYEEYQEGDQEEITSTASIYYDLFTWGSVYYTWERTVTTQLQSEEETDETVQTFGLDGTIPIELLRRPTITYSFGASYEDEQTDATEGEEEPSWEPTHTISVMDEFDLSKSIHLSLSATWEDTWEDGEPTFALPGGNKDDEDDEVTFEYNVKLSQQLGPRAQHSLTFAQEPEETFGSNADTEDTTFTYDFGLKDLFVYGLNFHASAEYEMETPLGEEDAETEETTTFIAGLVHTRQLSRKLARNLSYEYTWENSNFHEGGANEKHLVIYGFVYSF